VDSTTNLLGIVKHFFWNALPSRATIDNDIEVSVTRAPPGRCRVQHSKLVTWHFAIPTQERRYERICLIASRV